MYEYGTLKPVEVILRRRLGKRENREGMNQLEVHCMHIWKCHNETPSSTIINLKKFFLKKRMYLTSI
jgi:hypothetical protein